MNKKDLRKMYLKIRNDVCDKHDKSIVIMDKLIKSDIYINSNTIGVYLSFNSEVETYDLISYSLSIGKRVVVPKIDDDVINFYLYSDDLVYNKYGIEEPCSSFLVNDIDLLIVPGICFDLYGNRIGYGKGFYDKYLSIYHPFTVGICFKEQLCDKILVSDNDVKLDMILFD